MKIDPNNYDYIMYVDASGDDGFKFDKDSTTCYAAAALLVKKEDITCNLDILNQVKHIIGCKPTDELKYSRLRRHRHSQEALSLLSVLKGNMSSYVVFKKEVDQTKYKGNKNLSVVCHYMALRSIESYDFPAGSRVLLAIDHMKSTEEIPLNFVINAQTSEKTQDNINLTVVFRDSKDADFLLIQIADWLCGIIREHFEQYEINQDMLYFRGKCPPCQTTFEIRKKSSHPLCKNGKTISRRIVSSSNLKYIIDLFPTTNSSGFLSYFFTEPPIVMRRHFYMACTRKK